MYALVSLSSTPYGEDIVLTVSPSEELLFELREQLEKSMRSLWKEGGPDNDAFAPVALPWLEERLLQTIRLRGPSSMEVLEFGITMVEKEVEA